MFQCHIVCMTHCSNVTLFYFSLFLCLIVFISHFLLYSFYIIFSVSYYLMSQCSSYIVFYVLVSHCVYLSLFLCHTVPVSHCFYVSLFLYHTASVSHCFYVSLFLCLIVFMSHCSCVTLFPYYAEGYRLVMHVHVTAIPVIGHWPVLSFYLDHRMATEMPASLRSWLAAACHRPLLWIMQMIATRRQESNSLCFVAKSCLSAKLGCVHYHA